MRRCYLICYDIADDKRLARVREAVKDFGTRLQFSVYQCDLDSADLATLRERLRDETNRDEDRVIFVDLGNVEKPGQVNACVEWLGLPPDLPNPRDLVF